MLLAHCCVGKWHEWRGHAAGTAQPQAVPTGVECIIAPSRQLSRSGALHRTCAACRRAAPAWGPPHPTAPATAAAAGAAGPAPTPPPTGGTCCKVGEGADGRLPASLGAAEDAGACGGRVQRHSAAGQSHCTTHIAHPPAHRICNAVRRDSPATLAICFGASCMRSKVRDAR